MNGYGNDRLASHIFAYIDFLAQKTNVLFYDYSAKVYMVEMSSNWVVGRE